MSKKRGSVNDIAKECNLEVDEILLKLWELGFDEIENPNYHIKGKQFLEIKKKLGLPTKNDLLKPEFWQEKFQLSKPELIKLLRAKGIELNNKRRTLPKGSVKVLKKEIKLHIKDNPDLTCISNKIIEKEDDDELPELNWRIVGHDKELKYLEFDDVKGIHLELVNDFATKEDPIIPSGIRDEKLLKSALYRQHTSFGKVLKYPTVEMAGAALLHAIIHNHSFHNGNKRTALVSMLVFLDQNGLLLTCSESELFKFVLQVAQHSIVSKHFYKLTDRETMVISEWIYDNSRSIEKGERPIPFRKLRQILNSYDCELERPNSSGCKINISRNVEYRKYFKTNKHNLKTQIYYSADGDEVERNTINKLRTDLHLDEQHGVDSKAFYETAPAPIDHFIMKYRKTLDKLAKL